MPKMLIGSAAHVKMYASGKSGVVRTSNSLESVECFSKEELYHALRIGVEINSITEQERLAVVEQIEHVNLPRYTSEIPQLFRDINALRDELRDMERMAGNLAGDNDDEEKKNPPSRPN